MLTGLIKGLLLCCEDSHVTLNDTAIGNESEPCNMVPFTSAFYNIIILVILTGGVFGNITVLLVLSQTAFRGSAYFYLSGISLAHLGVLLSWIPIYIRLVRQVQTDYPSAFYSAHFELVTVNTFSVAGAIIISRLIADRYIFLFFPTRIRTGNSRKNAILLIICSFMFGFLLSAPLAAMRTVDELEIERGTVLILKENNSVTATKSWLTYMWIMEIVVRIVPTITMILLNGLIVKRFLHLNARKKHFQTISEKFRPLNTIDRSSFTRNRGCREELHLTGLTTCMISCFIVTMIPPLVLLIFQPNRLDSFFLDYRSFCITIELANFATDIFVYILCCEQFRRKFYKIITCNCVEDSDREIEGTEGEIDFSRHGTTIRLTPEYTKQNSPSSPRRLSATYEIQESDVCVIEAV